METILGLILQLLILGCQIAVCILGYVLVTRGSALQQTQKGPGPKDAGASEIELSEEERLMQEQMQRMMDGMNNILGYDGHRQGDKR